MGAAVYKLEPAAGRVPPSDLDAEAAVLSASMLSAEARDIVRDILRPEHFYADANRRICEAIYDLSEQGQPADAVTVAAHLRASGRIDQIGGTAYLSVIVDATPFVAHAETHARIVRDKARQRRMIAVCQSNAAEGYGDVGPVTEWLDRVEQDVFDAAESAQDGEHAEGFDTLIPSALANVRERRAQGGKLAGIDTGWSGLNEVLNGWISGKLYVLAGRPGMGKAQPLAAKVLTPVGWRMMGDLAVGDPIIGADGHVHRVTGVFEQGEKEVFRVTMSDGGSTVCCDDHLWQTRSRSERRANAPGSAKPLRLVRSALTRANSGGSNHSIPFASAASFDSRGALPIDPWLLGVYLGDGSISGSKLRISNVEPDVRRRVVEALPAGDAVAETPEDLSVKKAQRDNGQSLMLLALENLGLRGAHSWEKFVPEQFLFGSISERARLLQGLCDTDGYVTDPGGAAVEYCTTSPMLREHVAFLVGSLGGRVTWQTKKGAYSKRGQSFECREYYRVQISFPDGKIVPVSSEKHLAKYKPGARRITERFIASVEPEGRAVCRCISVSAPDKLYVTDDFIVTHNSGLALAACLNVAKSGLGSIFISAEMTRVELAQRAMALEARVPIERVMSGMINTDEHVRLTAAANELRKLPMAISERPGATLAQIRSDIRRKTAEMRARHGADLKVGLISVDYIQVLNGQRRGADSRENEVSGLSKGLMWLAGETKIPVLALSQLNRELEKRPDKRPQLSDLRESGSLEQDAYGVLFVYRDEYYNKDSEEKGIAEVNVSKHRNGRTGKVLMKFTGEYVRFATLDTRAAEVQQFDDFADNSQRGDAYEGPDFESRYP